MVSPPPEKSIFLRALELAAPAERRAYLDEACGGDLGLRAGIEDLLAAHDRLGGPPPCSAGDTATRDPGPAATTAFAPPPAPDVGAVVAGRYKLLEVVGEGGMGTVFLAEQTEPVRRRVALKVIKAGMDSRQVVARLEAERQALALMDHPNIAKVLDGGLTADGRPFFVMELVKGTPINKYCDEHRLTPRQRLELFVPVCDAVQHAHQKGVIHRDLKPSNVLVAPYDGRPVVKVIDFGIAKAAGQPLTEKTLFTGLGAVVGTPEYMSPEQAELNNADIDTRSDVYSLGVLLYELLTGTTPLTHQRVKDAALLEVLRLVREEEPPRPSTRLSTADGLPAIAATRGLEPRKLTGLVKGELDWIVMRALEKDRNRRYDTATGLAADLRRYLADEPVLACPPSVGYRLWKFVRRNKTAVTMATVFATLLLVGTVVSTWLAVRATTAEGLAEERLDSEKAEREKAVRAEREGKRQLVEAKLAQARAGRRSRQVGQRFAGLKALTEATALARELEMDDAVLQNLRDETVACLALADVRPLQKGWEGLPAGSLDALAFDINLERYARSDSKGNLEVRQVEGDRLLARLPGYEPGGVDSGASTILFSPDGNLLAVTYSHQVPDQPTNCQVWDWRRQEVVFRPPFSVALKAAMTFSPDGRHLAFGQQDGTIAVYEVSGWKGPTRLKAGSIPSCLAFHPAGDRLAVAGQSGLVGVWELATGKLLYQVSPKSFPSCLAWHPDGDLLAAACGDTNIHVWDGATGRSHDVLRGHQGFAASVAFAAGGAVLISSAWDGSSRFWDPWTGRELLRLTGDARHVSRDGHRLASRAGHTLAVWELNPGRECLTLPSRRNQPGDWSVSSDGRWLAGWDGNQCRIWDLVARKEVASLPVSGVEGVKFHPTTRELFTSSQEGLFRWSFEASDSTLRIRPTGRLLPPSQPGQIDLSTDGRLLAVVRGGGASILDLKDPRGGVPPLEHLMAGSVALSPDGLWAATGTHNGFGVRVWDARTGKLETELTPDEMSTVPAFSSDGRWLLIATGTEFGIWETGTWRRVRQIPREQTGEVAAAAAFTPDGKVLAVAVSLTTVRLFDAETWRPLARLEGPDTDLIGHIGFTPDGSQLLIMGGRRNLRIWDLRRIREKLEEIGLDWKQPPYRPAPPRAEVRPLRVELDPRAPTKK